MKLTAKIARIDYGDAAVKLLPLLTDAPDRCPGVFGQKLSAMADLSEPLIRDALSRLPETEKAALLSDFTAEHREGLLSAVNGNLSRRKLGVTVTDLSVSRNLEVTVTLGQLDYPNLVSRFLPAVRKKLLSPGGPAALLRPMIEKASPEQICSLLDRFAGGNRDAFLASLISQNQKPLISFLEKAAEREHISLRIQSVQAEV